VYMTVQGKTMTPWMFLIHAPSKMRPKISGVVSQSVWTVNKSQTIPPVTNLISFGCLKQFSYVGDNVRRYDRSVSLAAHTILCPERHTNVQNKTGDRKISNAVAGFEFSGFDFGP